MSQGPAPTALPPGSRGARSLHRQLLLWLVLPQVVLWVAAAIFTYNLAGRYANEAIDSSLSQATRALARQVKPTASGLFIDFPRSAQEILESDPTDRVLYAVSSPPGQFILGNPNLQTPVVAQPVYGEPYFYDATVSEPARADQPASTERIRVAALYLQFSGEGAHGGTMLVQVARSRANREELARRILMDTALPLSGLIVLMTVIVWAGIRAGLKPLNLLQSHVEGRAPNDLAPIEIDAAPREVHALARAINALLTQVHHNLAAQKRFISDAAHQLRTPLAGLKSQTELALGESTDPAMQARLQRVHLSATRSAHLVNQLLTLARAEPESAMRQHRAAVDMARLARELTAELVPRALAAGVDLGYDETAAEAGAEATATTTTATAPPTPQPPSPPAVPAAHPHPNPPPAPQPAAPPPLVAGIGLLLREALANLVDNAIRYAGRGASVTVRVRQRAGQVLLEVEDDGPGLPEPLRAQVFERFVRGTQDGEGCGLGLPIVREIAERHAGTVELLPVAPHGLLARMRLPQQA